MLVTQLLAVATVIPAVLGQDGPRRLNNSLAKRGDWDHGYYTDESQRRFVDWAYSVFDIPTIGNFFATASYVDKNIFCSHTEQRAWYQGAEYVLYSFGCGGLFWSIWPALGVSSDNCKGSGGGSNTRASMYCW